MKNKILSAIVASLFVAAPAAAENLTKEQVEKIVHDYIMNNAPVIMESVDNYQRKSIRDRSEAAIKTNFDALYKDDESPFIGNPDGDVVMVEFFDYNCGYCKKVLPTLEQLVTEDKNLKIIFKEMPILGPSSELASKWAIAAHKQEKYFPFHKAMMEHRGPVDEAVLEKIATAAGVDVARAKKDMEGTEIMLQIEKSRALAGQVGVSGTPAFVIGDQLFPGALPVEEMKRLIEEARKK